MTGPATPTPSLAEIAARLRSAATLTITQLETHADPRAVAAFLAGDVKAAEHDLTALIGPIPIPSTPAAPVPLHRETAGVEATSETTQDPQLITSVVDEVQELLAPAWTVPDRSPAYVLQDEWCRVCDQQPAPGGDGVCATCRADITEGRKTNPDGDRGTP